MLFKYSLYTCTYICLILFYFFLGGSIFVIPHSNMHDNDEVDEEEEMEEEL